jgi:hypothetical protein
VLNVPLNLASQLSLVQNPGRLPDLAAGYCPLSRMMREGQTRQSVVAELRDITVAHAQSVCGCWQVFMHMAPIEPFIPVSGDLGEEE